ncbi:hypothetical protein S40288_09441 [Stachybotrys chartarum IBT 40288]|nr:hypothetical protein S40288_09441 [Stachybotrys chartarum IBT 40288]
MSEPGQSSRRRFLLSSINPDDPTNPKRQRTSSPAHRPVARSRSASSRSQTAEAGNQDGAHGDDIDPVRPRRSRFRLKDEKRRSRSSRHADAEDPSAPHGSSRRHHHRRRRRQRSPTPPNPYDPPPLDADAAFRESLFDAMADDEGAAFWEGVYGQPVHAYAADKVGPTGELEQMTEEEYAAHVRQKMWEKTHAGLLEERARREQERKKKREEDRQNRKLQEELDRSLRFGDERRRRKRWRSRWEQYTGAWANWDGSPDTLAWPVDSGRPEDINERNVRDFLVHGIDLDEVGETAFVAQLKDERVRWHPDKVQQKLGGTVTEEVIKDVTAIFQIIDNLWTETRRKT